MKNIQMEIKNLAFLEMMEQEQEVQSKIQKLQRDYGYEAVKHEIELSGFSIILEQYLTKETTVTVPGFGTCKTGR